MNDQTTMTTSDLLARFVAPAGDARKYLQHPLRRGGWLYATDGHILVRVPDDPSIDSAVDHPIAANVVKLVEREMAAPWYSSVPIPRDLPALIQCKTCMGKGFTIECPHCEGEGEIETERGEWDNCPHCNGDGATPIDTIPSRTVTCPACQGRTFNLTKQPSVAIGAAHVNPYYLHLLALLSDVDLYLHDQHSLLRFSFAGGGNGLLMPMVQY